jgi:hypothetical protein
MLAYFDVNAKTQVITDASPVGLGAVLVQKQGEDYKIICYASRSLSDIERRYSQMDKEALGLVWVCERFHEFLFGKTIELFTDHKPLEFIFSAKSRPCAQVERWILRMQSYNYVVRHIPGAKNIADSLSCLLSETGKTSETSEMEEYLRRIVDISVPIAMSNDEIERASKKDEEIDEIRKGLKTGRWFEINFKEYLPVKSELCALGDLILRGTRIGIPRELRKRVLELGHKGHPGIVVMKQSLHMDRDVEQWCKRCYGCQLVSKPERPEPMVRTVTVVSMGALSC